MGLIAEIFTSPMFKGCSAGGISEDHHSVIVVGRSELTADQAASLTGLDILPIEGPFRPGADRPIVVLVRMSGGSIHARPVDAPSGRVVGPMAGGAYIADSDSRFRQAVGFDGAVSLHDRWEVSR